MTTLTPSHGKDTHAREEHPNRPYSGGNVIRLQHLVRRGFVMIPVTDIRGRTVLSAVLTGHAAEDMAAQSVTVGAIVEDWTPGKLTWNHQPAIGATMTTSVAAHDAGEAVDLNVLTLIQAVAMGTKWRGFRLATDADDPADSLWTAFDAPGPSWTLTIELSDVPEQPTDLRPNIGAVASSAPVLAWSYTDLGGDSSEQGAFKVQVDPDADDVSPAFDTGWIVSATPQYDLSSGSFTPLALHASTQWRVMTRDAAGNDSEWSDWATFSYEVNPTLVIDSPTGGTIGDSTPDIVAHLTGETLTQWRAMVEDVAGNVLWDSTLSDGPISITVAQRNSNRQRTILRDDVAYRIRVRAWGDVDRAVAVGHPAYVEQVVDVVFDDDAGVEIPDDFTAVPVADGDPRIVFTWTRSEAPDAVLIMDDGEVFARLDSDDWDVDAGTYTWTDNGLAQPYRVHHFTLRAVESGVRSHPSGSVTYTSRPEGVWLIPVDDDPVVLDGPVTTFQQQDRRVIYKPFNSPYDIDVVNGLEGVSGDFAGSLWEGEDVDVLHSVRVLERLRKDITQTPQLVWATRSIPVRIRNMAPLPDGENFFDDTLAHAVAFSFAQAGD